VGVGDDGDLGVDLVEVSDPRVPTALDPHGGRPWTLSASVESDRVPVERDSALVERVSTSLDAVIGSLPIRKIVSISGGGEKVRTHLENVFLSF
jgi:hypothetical protein